MRNYALITTAIGALLFGLSVSGQALAEEALAGTLPAASPSSGTTPLPSGTASSGSSGSGSATSSSGNASGQVFVPDNTASSSTGSATTAPSVTDVAPTTATTTVPVPSSTATLGGSSTSGKDILSISPATPQVVQDAVNRLQKTDQINLDDMIRAQDAINRLDLLLEIEKRQTEIKKIRDERNKPAAASLLGSAIPASALNLPKVSSLPAVSSETPAASPSKASFSPGVPASTYFSSKSSSSSSSSSSGPSDKYAIRRITGTDGHYIAVISTGDSSSQTAHVGDKMPDGSLVKSISLTSVSLFKDKKSKTLTIPTDSYIVRESGSSTE